jgi:2-dehydro-3-deoxyglucarate aldolase
MNFKQTLHAGQSLTGTWLTFASPLVAEALGHQGFDFLVIDTEHAPGDAMDVTAQLQAVGNTNAHPIVRVTELSAMLVKRAMDAGASTLLFPMIDTAEQARTAVAAMRYPPQGVRGMAGIVRAAKFGADALYTLHANDNACCIVQIESKTALANVQQIAAVEGVDCLFVGPADLSASLGVRMRDDALFDALNAIAQATQQAGKPCGIFAGDPEFARKARDLGYTLISLAADVMLLARGAKAFKEAFDA